MTKSSEVLRLAAEYALNDWQFIGPVNQAADSLNISSKRRHKALYYAEYSDYFEAQTTEENCMTLCLAAAIAESEGD